MCNQDRIKTDLCLWKRGSKVIRGDVYNEGADEVPGIGYPVVGSTPEAETGRVMSTARF